MALISNALQNYLEQHTEEEPELLQALARETHLKILQPIMLSGAYQGRVLSLISKLVRPTRILEIGTFTGYATLCLAEGLAKDGTIHTIDINEELENIQNKYFQKSGYSSQIYQHYGNALDLIPQLNETFDLVFIDADKVNYSNYFHAVIDKIASGGIILSDNVLWHGKVFDSVDDKDVSTQAIKTFNELLVKNDRVESVMLPIRDGITISRKI